MPTLSRSDILSRKALTQEEVNVPEWGGVVFVRELMANEADTFEMSIRPLETNQNGNKADPAQMARNFRAKIVVASCVDEQGNKLFTDADVTELGKMSRKALDRVATVAMRLSGYSAPEQETLKKTLSQDADVSSSASH